MTTYELVAIQRVFEHQKSREHGGRDMPQFYVLLSQKRKLYVLKARNRFSDCYSGYCGASRGSFDDLVPLGHRESFGPRHYVPKEPIEVEIVDAEFGHYHGKCLRDIKTGKLVVTSNGHGGDSWYPRGEARIEEGFFEKTSRLTDRRRVFLFTGTSGVGKSSIGQILSSKLEVYETDSNPELPEDLSEYDVVVIGQKYDFTIADVQDRYVDTKAQFVEVDFRLGLMKD